MVWKWYFPYSGSPTSRMTLILIPKSARLQLFYVFWVLIYHVETKAVNAFLKKKKKRIKKTSVTGGLWNWERSCAAQRAVKFYFFQQTESKQAQAKSRHCCFHRLQDVFTSAVPSGYPRDVFVAQEELNLWLSAAAATCSHSNRMSST